MLASPLSRGAVIGVLLAAGTVVLTGCDKSDETKAATQVAAKVNKNEISVHQINNVLTRAGKISPEQSKVASKQILDKLIDQDLLVQQAMEKKLDREPNTMQMIEASKREILSRAYLEKVASTIGKPTTEEVKEYYGKHPELFSERRIYNFRELTVQAQPEQLSKLQETMAKAKSLDDVIEWLKSQNIPISTNVTTKAAEQLPMELLPKFHQMKDGQIGVVPAGGGAVAIMQLVESRTAPIDEKAATPFVEQFLVGQSRNKMVEAEMKQLREKAKIEYMGEFATAKTDIKADDKTHAEKKESTSAPVAPKADAATDKSIEKGIAGLK